MSNIENSGHPKDTTPIKGSLINEGEEEDSHVVEVECQTGARASKLRWVLLMFGNFFLFGSYYCYDIPSALSIQLTKPIDEGGVGLSAKQYNLLYAVYSLPNIGLPLVGGIICDWIGVKISLMIFTSLVTIGQAVFTIGGANKSFTTMMIGRFIFGLGGETQFVCKSAIISNWFRGKELAFAFGVNLSFSRLGSVLAGVIEPRVAAAHGGDIGMALWIGFGFCVLSWFCGVGIVLCETYADKIDGKKAEIKESDKFRFKQLAEFTLPYWLIVISCCTVYCSIFPYTQNTADMLHLEFNVPETTASTLYSLPFFISAGVAPFLGVLVDKIGRRGIFIGCSSFLVSMSCVLTIILLRIDYPPGDTSYSFLAALILLGIAYSIYASSLWPSIPLVVKPHTLATAFGMCTSIQQVGLTIIPYLVGVFLHTDVDPVSGGAPPDYPYYGYVDVMALLAGTALFGTGINVWLYFDDKYNRGGMLNRVHGKESVTGVIKSMDDPTDPGYVNVPGSPNNQDYDPSDPVEAPHAGAQLTPRNQITKSMIESALQNPEEANMLARSMTRQSMAR